ncbi:MAG: hypothetical protein J7L15_08495, partial [Clostridiales bacterium]|nr:hypothetical protein [Clostridiales bacterium]
MDWKKTKNILIIALLIMNIFLIYNIYFKESMQKINPVDLSAVKDLLFERKIDISDVKHMDYSQMPIYSVKKEKYNLDTLSSLESSGYKLTDKNDVLSIYYDLISGDKKDFNNIVEEVKNILKIDDTNSKLIYKFKTDKKKIF